MAMNAAQGTSRPPLEAGAFLYAEILENTLCPRTTTQTMLITVQHVATC